MGKVSKNVCATIGDGIVADPVCRTYGMKLFLVDSKEYKEDHKGNVGIFDFKKELIMSYNSVALKHHLQNQFPALSWLHTTPFFLDQHMSQRPDSHRDAAVRISKIYDINGNGGVTLSTLRKGRAYSTGMLCSPRKTISSSTGRTLYLSAYTPQSVYQWWPTYVVFDGNTHVLDT